MEGILPPSIILSEDENEELDIDCTDEQSTTNVNISPTACADDYIGEEKKN